ncbi:hypothetical protein D5I55_02400 [Chakrabartia godavariana]|nr:hypothetical protein D5I55_02400 [Chakrabartia godavariana]
MILSTASARQDLTLLPLPDCMGERDSRIDAILNDLVRHKLAVEQVGVPLDQSWRTIDDQRVGLVLTPVGLKAIGVETDGVADAPEVEVELETEDQAGVKPTRASSKQQRVIDMC